MRCFIYTYRSLSLAISMLPLLFFSSIENISNIYKYQLELSLASFSAAFWVWFLYISYKFLPIWIVTSIRSLSTVISAIIAWYLLFDEKLTIITILFVIITIIWGLIISLSKVNFEHLDNKWFFRWIILAIFGWMLSATALTFMVKVSRELDPFVSWYFWELEIWIACLIILLFRKYFLKWKIEKISKKDFSKILLASSPTLIWTWSFALASLYWPIWIISAFWVFWIAISTIFWIYLFKEKLKLVQYLWIFIIIFWLLWIKLF
jgi:drug/metabolite transporter (DMT)-like permease